MIWVYFILTTDIADLVSQADAGYLSDSYKVWSQTNYLLTYKGTAILWWSTKQSIAATSSNHVKIIAIHETSRECVWLRLDTFHQKRIWFEVWCQGTHTAFEDNVACITQLKWCFIKWNRTFHQSYS